MGVGNVYNTNKAKVTTGKLLCRVLAPKSLTAPRLWGCAFTPLFSPVFSSLTPESLVTTSGTLLRVARDNAGRTMREMQNVDERVCSRDRSQWDANSGGSNATWAHCVVHFGTMTQWPSSFTDICPFCSSLSPFDTSLVQNSPCSLCFPPLTFATEIGGSEHRARSDRETFPCESTPALFCY